MKIKSTTYPQTTAELLELFADAYKYLLKIEYGEGTDELAQALKAKLFRSNIIPFINKENRKCAINLMDYKVYDVTTLEELKSYTDAKD